MLVINTAQQEQVERNEFNQFVSRVLSFFQNHDEFDFFTQTKSDKALYMFVFNGIDKARSISFFSERDIFKYLVASTLLGEDFDVDPNHSMISDKWARQSLNSEPKSFDYVYYYIKELQHSNIDAAQWLLG